MAKVKFTSALKRFFPNLTDMEVEGETVSEILSNVNQQVPGIADYILQEDGSLRKHVNIFLAEDLITDRQALSDAVNSKDEVLVYQALSGG